VCRLLNFRHEIPHYHARHSVKSGITGWAQVNGLRGDTDLTQRIIHDLYYVEHWNVLFDLKTMVLTFFKSENSS
jgi:lipopolysaccharide/colanic/teichoic acid biosynthesis glycosyltransferase